MGKGKTESKKRQKHRKSRMNSKKKDRSLNMPVIIININELKMSKRLSDWVRKFKHMLFKRDSSQTSML